MTVQGVSAATRRGFLGWRILAGCVVLQGLIAALFQQSYGVYASFWIDEFGWTSTTIALVYSLHRTESALLGPPHGWLLQRFSPRNVVLVGVIMLAGGFVALSAAGTLAGFVVAYLCMAVGASLAGLLSLTTVLVNWFERLRARALAIMATGLSIGGLAVPLVTIALVEFGWRTVALASGVLILAAGVPVSRLMHRDPESLGMRPDGRPESDAGKARGAERQPSESLRGALSSRTFWLLSLGHTSGVAIVSAFSVYFVLYVEARLGLSVTVAASILMASTAAVMAGQLVGGTFGDRVPKKRLAALGMFGHGAAMLLLALASSTALVVVAAVLHGVAWGMRGPLMSAMRADYFGRGSFALIMGASSLIVTLGSVGGPLLAGILADSTGEYGSAFLVLAGFAAAGVWAFAALPTPLGSRMTDGLRGTGG